MYNIMYYIDLATLVDRGYVFMHIVQQLSATTKELENEKGKVGQIKRDMEGLKKKNKAEQEKAARLVLTSTFSTLVYSGTSLIRTPLGQTKVCLLVRCPDFRGCNVHKQGVWDSPVYQGVLVSGVS